MDKKHVGIIGGGIVGTALGYHLSLHNNIEVTLFEKDQIGSGTTAKSAGTVCLFDDSISHEFWHMRLFGFQTFERMEKEERGSTGFDKTGTIVIATDSAVEANIKAGIALAKGAGYTGEYLSEKKRILEILPDLNLEGALGAGWTEDDGYFDASMISNTFVKKMTTNGGEAHPFTKVENLKISNNKVLGVETNKGSFNFDLVVDASGAWARYTSRLAGLELPLWHTKAEVFFLVPPNKKLTYTFPVLKYPRFYARREGDNIFICKAHLTMDLNDPMHAGIWDPDKLSPTGGTEDYFLEFLFGELEKHIPNLLDSGIASSWLGYRAEPPDFLPILGETPVEGFMLAVGCGGNGVIDAPMIGQDLALYIATGKKSLLLNRLPLSRYASQFDLRKATD